MGHGNRVSHDRPVFIETLKSRRIRDVACGSSHSAAITSSGELYTWGLGDYGRLGHGDTTTELSPKLVKTLVGTRIVQVYFLHDYQNIDIIYYVTLKTHTHTRNSSKPDLGNSNSNKALSVNTNFN